MHITDTIADMLTRIRNANNAKHDTVDIPASNMKKAIAQILLDEGYIKSFQVVEDGKQGNIRVVLKYGQGKSPVIQGLRQLSGRDRHIFKHPENIRKLKTYKLHILLFHYTDNVISAVFAHHSTVLS